MRRFGFILIAAGLALLVYFVIFLFQSNQTFHSPIPEDKGVKVIYITPSEEK